MSDSNTLLKRAKSALIAHDFTLAAKIYKSLIMEEPENIDYKMQLGNLYTKAGKDDQALTIFQQVLKTNEENPDALIAISGIYRRQKKYDESIALLEQARASCDGNPKNRAKIAYNLGFTYRQMGSYDDAIKCFEEVVEETPSDVLANNHLGAIYALQGNHAKAIEAYNRGLKFDANHPILQFNIAKSYAEIGDKTKALGFFEGALRAKPGWTEAIESYADLLLAQDKVSEADEVVSQALKINPDDVKMHTAKGNVYNRQSIFDNAESEFKKALNSDENYKNALMGLAYSLESQGKFDEALETINKAEKKHPDDTKIIRQAAHIHLSANELDEAYEKIEKLRVINKNDLQAINLLGQYHICKGEMEKAETCFAQIKKINPDYNDVYRDWGERFIQTGRTDKAEPYLLAAIQKKPNDANAMVSLGELYEKKNLMGKALQFYKKASNADPYNQRSKDASERIVGDDANLDIIGAGNFDNSPIDFDSLFSGGKIEANSLVEEVDSPSLSVNEQNEEAKETLAEAGSSEKQENQADEMAAPENEGQIAAESEDTSGNADESENADPNGEDFNFEQFGMEKLANTFSGADDIESVASLLKSGENALEEGNNNVFDELIDDGAPIDEDDDINNDFVPLPEGNEILTDANIHADSYRSPEVESPAAQKKEITEDSLDKIEEQIKRAAELAEKANYAAESAWAAANQVADAAQAARVLPPQKEAIAEEPEDETLAEEASAEPLVEDAAPKAEGEELDSEALVEDATPQSREEESFEETQEDDSFLDEDLLSAEEKLAESEILDDNELEGEDELFDEDIMEEEPMNEETEEFEEKSPANEGPKVDDLTLRRAINMLPSIIAAIEDRSLLYRFRSFLSMFKTLREMLEYLPPAQRREFMTSRNRLLLDYVISKLSGKPGLYATTKALVRSGLIHENPENKASEKDGIELVKEVLADLRKLSEGLEDDTLKEVLNKEADSLEEKI